MHQYNKVKQNNVTIQDYDDRTENSFLTTECCEVTIRHDLTQYKTVLTQ